MVDAEITTDDKTEGANTANVDTESLTVGAKTVNRQRVQVAGSTDTAIAVVKNTAPTTEFGLVTRNIPSGTQPVSGTVSVTEPVSVDDNAGSLTVDAPVGTPVANRLSDGTAFLTTTSGRLSVDASGVAVPVTDNAGTLTVDQATAANLKTEAVGASADNSANTTTKQPVIPARANAADPLWTEGNQAPLSVDLAGNQRSAISKWIGSTTPTVGQKTMASSLPVVVSSDQSALTIAQATASSLKNEPAGNIAHDGIDSGNPIKMGLHARQTNPTTVADADRANAICDDIGRQVIIMNQVRDLVIDATTTISTTTETTILAAAVSTFHDIVLITIANTSATATRVDFRDTTGGAVRFSLYVPAGATIGFAPPIPVKQTTVNTNWTATLGTAVTDVRIFIQCVKNV